MKPIVIDIYHGDAVFDFNAVKQSGIVGVIHKATEGTGYVDALYSRRRKAFTDIGLAWGAYHFFHGNGKQEADFFLSRAEPDSKTLLALDWETTLRGYSPTASQARAFLERIIERAGRKAVVYSGHVAKDKINGRDAFFGSHRLWLAQYGVAWRCQQSWNYPWLWQYRGDVTGYPGVGKCDLNTIVRGTPAELLSEWAGAPSAPVPVGLLSGKGSWYSQYRGRDVWRDTGDRPNSNALGVPDSAQGISFYSQATLGKWFEVHAPNGNVSIEQQTDRGPHPSTGRKIDISAAAAERFGYSPDSFPTDGIFRWRQVDPPALVHGLSPRVAALRYRDMRFTLAKEMKP